MKPLQSICIKSRLRYLASVPDQFSELNPYALDLSGT